MQAHRYSAARGWSWISAGFDLYRRNPRFLGTLGMGYSLLSFMLMVLVMAAGPVIAMLLVPALWLCVPALWLGALNGCRAVAEERGGLTPALLFSGFRRYPKKLLLLGFMQFCGWLLVLLAFAFLGGGDFLLALKAGKPASLEELNFGGLLIGVLAAAVLALPLVMAFWFAPLLVAWNDLGVGKALFFSLVACGRNLAPFAVYGLAGFAVMLLLPLTGAALSQLLPPSLANLVVMLLQVLVFVPLMFASIYVGYQDIFVVVAKPDAGAPSDAL